MGYGLPIIPGRIYESPLNSAHNELSDLEGKAHISETKYCSLECSNALAQRFYRKRKITPKQK